MYIHDLACISPQPTIDNTFLTRDYQTFSSDHYVAIEPDYKQVIPRNLLRKMGKAVKMGIWNGMQLVDRNPAFDGIVIGTSEGAAEDFVNFIGQILKYDEGTLTPTAFVQSAPNSLAGTLALMSQNTGYNSTYVDRGTAFESALLDALMLFEENHVSTLLVGNTEQYSQVAYNIEELSGFFKKESVTSEELLSSGTPGTAIGEGSLMCALSNEQEGSYARIIDVTQMIDPTNEEIRQQALTLLQKHGLHTNDIDAVVYGWNGDSETDQWYNNLREALFATHDAYAFKNLCGEYPTSTAFGMWLSTHLLYGSSHSIPKASRIQAKKETPQTILLYNHYRGINHSLILLGKE